MDEKMIIEKWVIVAKWSCYQIIEHKSCISHKCFLFFSKKYLSEKNKILQCGCWYRCQCVDFQIAFKVFRTNNHNNVSQKLKETTDIHQNKIELEKIHLNKQMIQNLQRLINVYIFLDMTCFHHTLKQFQQSHEKHPERHIFIWKELLISPLNFWRTNTKCFEFCRIYFLCSK